MPLEVYDYRTDLRNLVITPEIRSRFMRLEAGAVASRHSHDLGHEVFVVLEGRAEFEIDGERAILCPGQMCFALAGQLHQIRVVGDGPMSMYLSVTPHLEPTHTFWDERGNKLSPRYGNSTSSERAALPRPPDPPEALADRHVAAAKTLAEVAEANAAAQEGAAAAFKRAVVGGDRAEAKDAVDAMWDQMYRTYRSFQALEAVWNELAPRAPE